MAGANDKLAVLICPATECQNEIEQESDGTYPACCEECGEDLQCPFCQKPRKVTKKGFANFCGGCKYNYKTKTQQVIKKPVLGVSEHPPTDKPPVAGSSASSADKSVDSASNSPNGSTSPPTGEQAPAAESNERQHSTVHHVNEMGDKGGKTIGGIQPQFGSQATPEGTVSRHSGSKSYAAVTKGNVPPEKQSKSSDVPKDGEDKAFKELKDRIEAAARVMSKENVTLAGTEKKNLEAMVKKLENLPTSSKKKANKKSKHSSEGYYSKFMEEAKQFDIFSILEKVEKHVEGSKAQRSNTTTGTKVTRANSRDIEFWAVLVNAPSENDSKLVVEIRSNYASFEFTGGAPLATMKQQDGVWKGNCSVPKVYRNLIEYKYFVKIKGEKLGEFEDLVGEGNRYLSNLPEGGDPVTVYDGGIVLKNKSGIVTKFVSLFSSKESPNRKAGFDPMLPNWVEEVWKGSDIDRLGKWVNQVKERQLYVLSGWDPRPGYKESSQKDVDQLMKKYVQKQMEQHYSMVQNNPDIAASVLSMIGLIDISQAVLASEEKAYFFKDISKLAENTANYISTAKDWPPGFKKQISAMTQSSLRSYSSSLMHTSKLLYQESDCNWLLLIPFIHVLNLQETQDMYDGNKYHDPKWWGTDGFDQDVQTVKQRSKHSWDEWKIYQTKLETFFNIDSRLTYTFLALLNANQLKAMLTSNSDVLSALPLDGVVACVNHHVESVKSQYDEKASLRRLLLDYLIAYNAKCLPPSEAAALTCVSVAGELLKSFPTVYSSGHVSRPVWKDVLTMTDLHLSLLGIVADDNGGSLPSHIIDNAEQILEFSMRYLHRELDRLERSRAKPQQLDMTQLQLWKDMFKMPVANETVATWWCGKWGEAFIKSLNELYTLSSIFNVITSQVIDEPNMDSILRQFALSHVDWWLENESSNCLPRLEASEKVYDLVYHAVSKDFREQTTETDLAMTFHLLEYKQFVAIWKFCDQLKNTNVKKAETDIQRLLTRYMMAFETVIEGLMSGAMSLGAYQQMANHKQMALSLCGLSEKYKTQLDNVSFAFDRNADALKNYQSFWSTFSSFWQTCKSSISNSECVDEWINQSLDTITFNETIESLTQTVICPVVPVKVKDLLPTYDVYKDKTIFRKMMQLSLEGNDGWEELASRCQMAIEQYQQLVTQIENGSMKVSMLRIVNSKYFGGDTEEMLHQLRDMISKDMQKQRLEQINICMEMEQYFQGAQALLTLKEMFNLENGFTEIEELVQLNEEVLELNKISRDLVDSADVIRSIAGPKLDCLQAFAESSEFVNWIKQEVKKDEISVFVDLVSNSIGEDSMATHKTRYIHNTLTGYSPLLYDFDESVTKDLKSFLELCQKVWKNLEANPDLAENMRCSAGQAELFKSVNSNYGNTEKSAIAQATVINSRGLYRIGKVDGFTNEFKTLEDVILLTCDKSEEADDEGLEESKHYRYSELKDLQSRLALVAGEKQREHIETITAFEEMRDAVENLGVAYLEIKRAGCILFDDMFVIIHCNPEHRVAVEITLQASETPLYGRTFEKSALKHCQNIYNFLSDCFQKWKAIMESERREHPELNFFTTAQLVILRKELGTFADSKDSATLQKALPLLSMIHKVTAEHLLEIIKQLLKPENVSQTTQEENSTSYHQIKETVDYIREEIPSLTKEEAVKIVNAIGDDAEDIDLVRKWIQKQQEELESQTEALGTSDQIISDLMKQSQGVESSQLQDQLKLIWTGFATRTSQSIRDVLSVSDLGHVLHQLIELKSRPQCCRVLPSWLTRGKPLLIATSQANTYKLVLSIYEADQEFEKPTRNEVLICNTKTRKDEVSLFLNRALNDPMSFYCMVNCHLLTYKVTQVIENRLNNLADHTIDSFGLAFIYDERAKNCRIKVYLDKHLVKNPMIVDEVSLRAYVSALLKVDDCIESASSVDPDRSFARILRSTRAGVGKSLQRGNLCQTLRQQEKVPGKDITISAHRQIETDEIMCQLFGEFGYCVDDESCDTIHLDIAHEVEAGVDEVLFNLIILGSLVNSDGIVWQIRKGQYYIIECMPFTSENNENVHTVLDLLPTMHCLTPLETFQQYKNCAPQQSFVGFDSTTLHDERWQLVLKHLVCLKSNNSQFNLRDEPIEDACKALELLIKNCGLEDPTWSELRHYVHFLSSQLTKVLASPFCGPLFAQELPGFKSFVVKFMLTMAKDFATRSLKIAEETPGKDLNQVSYGNADKVFSNLSMKKTWEKSNYPYLFFNEDGESFTTLGFHAESRGKEYVLINKKTQQPFSDYNIPRPLYDALIRNQLPISEDFNTMERRKQLQKLRSIMVKEVTYTQDSKTIPMFTEEDYDPDPNYVLTMDNAKKIIAIHQRLRVGIPVIVMGETGCGKTKLINFMSLLQIPSALKDQLQTMIIVKVHGGTTEADIEDGIRKAQSAAEKNQEIISEYASQFDSSQIPEVYTILFLDEVNTTEAVGLVKEIICDNRINGKPLSCDAKLKIIAACNPYRRHTDAMIIKLKEAGLGYNVKEEDTKDRFGHIPMRHLVYRVQPLPQSLLPLVWDFGTLQSDVANISADSVESAYIRQMIVKFEDGNSHTDIHFSSSVADCLSRLLSKSQTFMRRQQDECSFVSLRDIQRFLDVAKWFYSQRTTLYLAMESLHSERLDTPFNTPNRANDYFQPTDEIRSLLLSIGVCYLARLEEKTRQEYVRAISSDISSLLDNRLVKGSNILSQQLTLCQDMLINEVVDSSQHKNIAKNKALKENVFMMIVCIETRIPLFVIGKPGSSKSLSKAMVLDAMKGGTSKRELFRAMKDTYMVSFQCSKHATPSGIVGVFQHCATFQEKKNLDEFVSVVVLDEVGLAEDSENMPLKTLHPLLEDGCLGNEAPEPHKKCAFIGISNWALDPAKMNRGIFIQIGVPATNELEVIAREICRSSNQRCDEVESIITPLSTAYRKICEVKKPDRRDLTEFFGLRDFYSLIKMVVNFARGTGYLTVEQVEHSIKRNFGGFDMEIFDPMTIFRKHCPAIESLKKEPKSGPPTDSIGLIKSSLFGSSTGMDSRYLLVLTENLSVLSVILDQFAENDLHPEVVFGSRFSDDVSYTQVCHNLYRIKMCMDMGRPVILLNLDDLYESLYDALNQYFSKWGNKKFVDLGLGTHRVKAFVHDSFRLVLIADKNKVHSQFPIPLINRLEKHYVSTTSLLTADQKAVKDQLENWLAKFVEPFKLSSKSCPENCHGCGKYLSVPYRVPCPEQHYIGECCRQVMRETCPVEDCNHPIEDFEWTIDKAALEKRQYFENSAVATSFIGYSSECTALVVRKASDQKTEIASVDQLWKIVLKRAKSYMLQCATAECILRLDRTVLKEEAAEIQAMYLERHCHETLLQFLNYALSQHADSDQALRIQVTTFAELMSYEDIDSLQHQLNTPVEIKTIFLKNFSKESLFTEAVRSFYGRFSEQSTKLLLIQCESANESIELLDSVRYIIQRESPTTAEYCTHTILLLSLARGQEFAGYQGGNWTCVHIDDPRPPQFRLPSLQKCLEIKPSQLIRSVLNFKYEANKQDNEDNCDSFDNMPPLEDVSEDEDTDSDGESVASDVAESESDESVDQQIENSPTLEPEDQTDLEVEDQTILQTEDQTDLEVEDQRVLDSEDQTDLEVEDQTILQTEDQTDPEAGDQTEMDTEDETDLDTEDETDLATKHQRDLDTEDGTILETRDQTDLEVEGQTVLQTEHQTDLETESQTHREPDVPTGLKTESSQLQDPEMPKPCTIDLPAVELETTKDAEDIMQFIRDCLPYAMSLIECADHYDRISEIRHIYSKLEFRGVFLKHVYELLRRQEEFSTCDWVKTDAANACNMKKSETLRHALEDSLERSFRPALAAVIVFIDRQKNLKILNQDDEGMKSLWLQIFSHCGEFGLNFDQITQTSSGKTGSSRLPASFLLRSAGKGNANFTNKFPFSWIVKEIIDKMVTVFKPSGVLTALTGSWLIDPFNKSLMGRILEQFTNTELYSRMMNAYLHDFVYMSYHCSDETEHWIIQKAFSKYIELKQDESFTIAHIHLIADELKEQISNLLAVFRVETCTAKDSVSQAVKDRICTLEQDGEKTSEENEAAASDVGVHNTGKMSFPVNNGESTLLQFKNQMPRFDVVAAKVAINMLFSVPLVVLLKDTQNWIYQVDQCKQVLEKVLITSHPENDTVIHQCRLEWFGLELKKLYVEHVIMPGEVNTHTGNRKPQKITTFIKAVTKRQFYQKQSFDEVLSSISAVFRKELCDLYENCPSKCPVCASSLDTPAKLPCGHIICDICVKEIHNCPQCTSVVPERYVYDPESDDIDPTKLQQLIRFRKHLNSFFKNFVAELVFLPGVVPELEVIEWLTLQVTFKDTTKTLSIFNSNDVIDATPVLRSFLIKLLMGCPSEDYIQQYLNSIMRQWAGGNHYLPTLCMIVNCYKDMGSQLIQQRSSANLSKNLEVLIETFKSLMEEPSSLSLDVMAFVAELHCFLVQASDEVIMGNTDFQDLLKELLKMFQQHGNLLQPSYYIVRQLIDTRGQSFVKDLINTPMNFLIPSDVKKALSNYAVPDILEAFSQQTLYAEAKQLIDKIVENSSNPEKIEASVAKFYEVTQDDEALMLHTLFTRVTRTFADAVSVPEVVSIALLEGYSGDAMIQAMLQILLDGESLPESMKVSHSKGMNLSMLVLHLFTSLYGSDVRGDLFPLSEIVFHPTESSNHLFPTMKDNELEIIQAEFKEEKTVKAFETQAVYCCPNGCPYFIRDCSRPYYLGKCICGETIGGQRHEAASGNRLLSDEETKCKPGHIIGHAVKRGSHVDQERDLSPLHCAVLRCLVHLSMYTATLFNKAETYKMIYPQLNSVEEVSSFLEAHIQVDLRQLSNLCGASADDCILMLHDVMHRMKQDCQLNPEEQVLSDRIKRKVWETKFAHRYISATFGSESDSLKSLKAKLSLEKQTDLTHILSTDSLVVNEDNVLATPGLWKFVRPWTLLSVENLISKSETEDNEVYPFLRCVVKNCEKLIALGQLPDIVSLVLLIREKFHGQFTRAEAKELRVRAFLRCHAEDFGVPEPTLYSMVQSYVKAWNSMLKCSDFAYADVDQLPEDPLLIELLLDKHRGTNCRVRQLISYLSDAHNSVISQFDQHRPAVPVTDITKYLLASVSSLEDVISLITSHTEYQLDTETHVSYNLHNVEHDMRLKYAGAKAKIKAGSEEFNALSYVFKEDFNMWSQINILRPKQERLSRDLENYITAHSSRSIKILTSNIKELNTVINYLYVMPEYDLEEGLQGFLKQTIGSVSMHLSDEVKLKHVLHVWVLIKFSQASCLMANHQKPFDAMGVSYVSDMSEGIEEGVNAICTYNSPRTLLLLQQLFEYITLQLNREAASHQISDTGQSLQAALTSFIQWQYYMVEGDSAYWDSVLENLPTLPEVLKVEHAASVWSYMWRRYTTPVEY